VARPDVLLVSLGTTLGWRVADEMLAAQLERAGAATEIVSIGRGAADRLRRGYPVNDLVEMYAARRTAGTAVTRLEPRTVIVSSTTAAMLLPRLPMPFAIRLDAPACLNRPGKRNALLHRLERSAMRRALLTIPYSVAGAEALPEGAPRPIVVSPPIDPSSPDGGEPPVRERLAVAYVPDPKAKGLDVLVSGWAAAQVDGARLEVYGLDPASARSHLDGAGVPGPDSLDLRGTVPAAEFRARLRRAHAFVHAARWEDWGQAPLEALADGALLATVPAGGPYEGGRLARELAPSLVADTIDPDALGDAIRAAFELSGDAAGAYRARAAALLRPYRSEAVQETVTRELLPALLAPTPPHPHPADAAP
jgi:glycosyltransferase involved in cell wall biosynthesis